MGIFKKLGSNILFLSGLNKKVNTSSQDIGVVGVNKPNSAEDQEAIYPSWFFSAKYGQPRDIDLITIRTLSKSAWVQMVMNTFKRQISTIPYDIVNEDEEDETDRTEDIKKVKFFLNKINNNFQTVEDLNSELITDISEIDAGVLNYVYSTDSYKIGQVPVYDAWGRIEKYEEGLVLKPLGQRKLIQIKSVDGGTILKQVDIHKNLLGYWQYSFKHPRQNPTRFDKEEIAYLLMNAKSYDVYGFSPVQSIQQILELLIQGTRYNKDLYKNNAVPDYLVSLPKLSNKELVRLKRLWNQTYKNRPHQIGFVNWLIDHIHKLSDSNRDLEWLDGQKWYKKIVFGVFGVSPTEAGFFENANKSNDEGQARVTVRNALLPYLKKLERLHTIKTITEILGRENHGLKFKYFPKDQVAEEIEFNQDIKEIEIGALTINEYRRKKGKEPVEWGDEPLRRPFDPNINLGFSQNSASQFDNEENKKFRKSFERFLNGRESDS